MTNAHLLILLEESGFSPEALGARIGISGMSIRRWLKASRDAVDNSPIEITDPYASAFQALIQKLVIEGNLAGTSRSAIWAFGEIGELASRASIAALGVNLNEMNLHETNHQSVVSVLSQIGAKPEAEKEILKRSALIATHRRTMAGWTGSISRLQRVVRSKTFTKLEKSVAIGALFYLVFMFDLIPDTIPVFGYIDDFAVVGIASAYYQKRETDS